LPVYLAPCEDVTLEGDIGREMFFILEGEVEVIANDAHVVLRPRQCFGERALIEPNHVRTALTRTVTFCELRKLTADTLRLIIARHRHSDVTQFLNRITERRLKRRAQPEPVKIPDTDSRRRRFTEVVKLGFTSHSSEKEQHTGPAYYGDSFKENIELPALSPPSQSSKSNQPNMGDMTKVIVTNDEFSKSVSSNQLINSLVEMQKEMSRISDRFDQMESRFDRLVDKILVPSNATSPKRVGSPKPSVVKTPGGDYEMTL
jgi:CRP-like cAMP-binding protein